MTNGGIIEGQRSFLFRCSDLSSATYLVGRIRYEASSNPRRATMQCVATQHLARKKDGQRHPTNLFCQSVPKTPMKVGEPWATIGRAATHAGRWTNIPEQSLLLLSGQCRNSGGSGATLRAVSLRKPAIEKEARLRPQQLSFGSGAGLNNQSSLWRN